MNAPRTRALPYAPDDDEDDDDDEPVGQMGASCVQVEMDEARPVGGEKGLAGSKVEGESDEVFMRHDMTVAEDDAEPVIEGGKLDRRGTRGIRVLRCGAPIFPGQNAGFLSSISSLPSACSELASSLGSSSEIRPSRAWPRFSISESSEGLPSPPPPPPLVRAAPPWRRNGQKEAYCFRMAG